MLQSTTPVLLRTTKYYPVLHSTRVLLQNDVHPVLLRTTKYYSSTTPELQNTTPVLLRTSNSSTTPYYKALLRTTKYYSSTTPYSSTTKYYSNTTKYYSSTTPVLLLTTKHYSVLQSTTPYQYYSVLQSTTPVLLQYYSSTTKYYCSTAPYYKVLVQYYPVLQSTTLYYKVLLRPKRRQNYKVLLRNDVRTTSIQYYSVLQSTTPVLLRTNTTPVLLRTTKYYSVLSDKPTCFQSDDQHDIHVPCSNPEEIKYQKSSLGISCFFPSNEGSKM